MNSIARVTVRRDHIRLAGNLYLPAGAGPFACIVFVHGLGSGKDSPRNVVIAARLVDAGIAAVLFDLSGHGESDPDPREGIEAFVEDLDAVFDWASARPEIDPERIGVAGSSLGGVVALDTARRQLIHPAALVLRAPPAEGRQFVHVEVPVLVIAGGRDPLLSQIRNATAMSEWTTLSVVDGAGHLFEEPGTLEQAVAETVDWFKGHLSGTPEPSMRDTGGGGLTMENTPEATEAIFALRKPVQRYPDRVDAGRTLGACLEQYKGRDVLVLGIPRGGVPVAAEVARALGADLDVIVARKLGAPGQPELAIGAVTSNGGRFLNQEVIEGIGVTDEYLQEVTAAEIAEAHRREEKFRAGRPAARIRDRIVIVVDDGLATGATMRASVRSVRKHEPARLVVAVPVGSRDACAVLRQEADEMVCLYEPAPFWAVGLYYENFEPTLDDEVAEILQKYQKPPAIRAD
jgi:predicted phosphoribosyltransferase/dienelactone hydrolase